MSMRSTPASRRLVDLVVDDLSTRTGRRPGEELALGLGMPRRSKVFLTSSGTSSDERSGVDGHESSGCCRIDLGQRRAPGGLLARLEVLEAFEAESRIHCGSDLNSEIFSTISRLMPLAPCQ